MPLTQQQLNDPQIIGAVSRLEFHAREVVEGVIVGLHKSPYRGYSVEFAQHREYTPGDEIRYIDWKVAARSDRFYVKEFEEETNLKGYLLVDTSESMRYQGRRRAHSKLEYACIAAAAFASLLIQQRDAAGLALFNDGVRKYVPPRSTGSHFTQILDEDEIRFPFDDLTKFEGLELEPELLVDPRGIREEYLRQFNSFCDELDRGCREIQVDLIRMTTSTDPAEALTQYIAGRRG